MPKRLYGSSNQAADSCLVNSFGALHFCVLALIATASALSLYRWHMRCSASFNDKRRTARELPKQNLNERSTWKPIAPNHYRAYSPKPFAKEERGRTTILFGGLHWRVDRVLQGVFANQGYTTQLLPTATKEDLLTGREVADIASLVLMMNNTRHISRLRAPVIIAFTVREERRILSVSEYVSSFETTLKIKKILLVCSRPNP